MKTAVTVLLLLSACATTEPRTYATPEAAVQGLLDGLHDRRTCEDLLGPGGCDLLAGDATDEADFAAMRSLLAQGLSFEDTGDGRKIALLGEEHWRLPLPLVHVDGRWRFDVPAGREELRCRRVGGDELLALAALHEFVDSQAQNPAHRAEDCRCGPMPGYSCRVLRGQGEHAAGGARSYVAKDGTLDGGFAVIAWPEDYGHSGVMTFQVNQLGIVYEKNLGPETATAAALIASFDPDLTWEPVAQ